MTATTTATKNKKTFVNLPYLKAEILEVRPTGAVKAQILVGRVDGEKEMKCTLWFAPGMIDPETGKPYQYWVREKFSDLKYGDYGRAYAHYSVI